MNKKRIVIIGAGITGLSAAWHLQKKGVRCTVFEKEASPGGLCRSKRSAGFIFDYCGHLLHFRNSYACNFIRRLLKGNLNEHRRDSWIHYKGSYVKYPFQANLYGLPPEIVKECLLGFIQASGGNDVFAQEKDFFTWIQRMFGPGIARHFMVPYNEKFWTVHPRRLNCEWLNPFIPVPSLNRVVDGTVRESSRELGYNARFRYPAHGGIGVLPRALCSEITGIVTGCAVTAIDPARKELVLSSGARERYDACINTAPLPEIPKLMVDLPTGIDASFKKLRWNSIINLNLGVRRRGSVDRRHWIYFPHKDISFFRIGYFTSFSRTSAPAGAFSLYAEAAYSKHKPLDKTKITTMMLADLRRTGALRPDDEIVVSERNDIKYAYPLYDRAYHGCRKRAIEFLGRKHIICAGRYGAWRYFSMEDSLLDGRRAAEEVCNA
jgi:protoporphyrinogen oxidase